MPIRSALCLVSEDWGLFQRSLTFGDALIIWPRELAGILKAEMSGIEDRQREIWSKLAKQVSDEAVVNGTLISVLAPEGSMPEIAKERSGEMTVLSPGQRGHPQRHIELGKVDDRPHVHRTASCRGRMVAVSGDR